MEAEERTDGAGGEVVENRSLLVLYGTETGKSQEIAQEIGRAAEALRFQTQVEEMNDVPLVSSATTLPPPRPTPHQGGTKLVTKVNEIDGASSRKSCPSAPLQYSLLRRQGKETSLPTPPPSGRAS